MDTELLTIGATFVIAAAILLLIVLLAGKSWSNSSVETVVKQVDDESEKQEKKVVTKNQSKPKKDKLKDKYGAGVTFSHDWLCTNLKGHSSRVLDLDFSSNGRNLVSCSDDRTLMLWNLKDFPDKEHKSFRGNVDLDHAKLMRFAPDSKSLILCLAGANKLSVYKLVKKDGATYKFEPLEGIEFPQQHKRDISCIGIACNGKFIMSASPDTTMIIWSLRGDVYHTIETKQSTIHHAAVSPCGRFVASSGFTPDVKVWEVQFERTGDFKDVVRAFELKGHSSGIYSFDFSQDSGRMISASKDGTWRLWDTDIRYGHGQEPYLLASGEFGQLRSIADEEVFAVLSPSADSFVIGVGNNVRVYESESTDEYELIESVHQHPFTGIRFSHDGKYMATSGDKHIRVFHNIAGYKAQLKKFKKQMLKPQGEAHKRRLQESCEQLEKTITLILN